MIIALLIARDVISEPDMDDAFPYGLGLSKDLNGDVINSYVDIYKNNTKIVLKHNILTKQVLGYLPL